MSTWPNRGASGGPCGGLAENEPKQPKQPSDHAGLTQANRPPRNPVRFKLLMHDQAVEPPDLGFSNIAISEHGQGDDSGGRLRAVRGITAHDGSTLGAVGRGSVEDVAQPGLLAAALRAPTVLEIGVRKLGL